MRHVTPYALRQRQGWTAAVRILGRDSLSMSRWLVAIVPWLLFAPVRELVAQDTSSIEGKWSEPVTAQDHPAWRIEDHLCVGCSVVAYEHLRALLADPANDERSLRELGQEARRIDEDYFERLLTDTHRERLSQYPQSADPSEVCEPPKHLLRVLSAPEPLEIIVGTNEVVLHQQSWNVYRRFVIGNESGISSDGSGLSESSTARFEGASLIIESHNVHGGAVRIPFTQRRLVTTDAATIIERYTPSEDGSRLEIRFVVNDTDSFTEPFVMRDARVRTPDIEMFEYESCERPDPQ